MSAPAQPLPKAPITRLGNTAMLVHAIGIGTGGVLAVYGYLHGNENKDDAMVMLGMGLAVAVVAWFWSMLLRARALWHGESAFWPMVLTVLSGIELLGVSVLFWQLAAPVLAVGIVGSGIAAGFINKWRERKDIKRGAEPWDRAIRYQRKVRTFAVVFTISAVTVLPVALRGYSLQFWPDPILYRNFYYRLSSWVPESFDHYCMNSKRILALPYHATRGILTGGVHQNIRNEILRNSTHPLHTLLFHYIEADDLNRDSELRAVCKEVISIENGSKVGSKTPWDTYGQIAGQNFSISELKEVLHAPERFPPEFSVTLFSVLDKAKFSALKPELLDLCTYRPGLLTPLIYAVPERSMISSEDIKGVRIKSLTRIPLSHEAIYDVDKFLEPYWRDAEVTALIDKNWASLFVPDDLHGDWGQRDAITHAHNFLMSGFSEILPLEVLLRGLDPNSRPSVRRSAAEAGESVLIQRSLLISPVFTGKLLGSLTPAHQKRMDEIRVLLSNLLQNS